MKLLSKPEPLVYIYTDGSCSATDELGAWTTIVVSRSGDRKVLYGSECPTTISRCELLPIIAGLRWVRDNWRKIIYTGVVRVYSDSEYTVRTIGGEYVAHKNLDLWHTMNELQTQMTIEAVWYEHNGTQYIETVDAICHTYREGVKQIMTTLLGDYKNIENVIPNIPLCNPERMQLNESESDDDKGGDREVDGDCGDQRDGDGDPGAC